MIRKTALALLVLVASLVTPSGAFAATAHPIFTRADVGLTGSWTGYRATIYVAPLTYAIWAGGYLSDGTFIQSGLITQGHDDLYAFAWATHDPSSGANGQVPLIMVPTYGLWVTIELAQSAGRWMFRFHDAAGWHVQGSWRSNARISTFQVVSEYWAEAIQPFRTQIVKDIRVRTGATWAVPSHMATSSSDEQCGHDLVTSPYKGKLVFRSIEAPCRGYVSLW